MCIFLLFYTSKSVNKYDFMNTKQRQMRVGESIEEPYTFCSKEGQMKNVWYLVCRNDLSCFCTSGFLWRREKTSIRIPKSMNAIANFVLSRFKPTCRWLFTWEIVSPLTSINWRTSLGVASAHMNKNLSLEVHHSIEQ